MTAVTDIVGTVQDENLISYTLLIAPFGANEFVELARGTTNVSNDVLGQLDPTLLSNDDYVLRLQATDAGGNVWRIEQMVSVAGNMKVGNFQLTFSDATANVGGIPITIARTYDSLRANTPGDFGYGWSLAIWDAGLKVSLPSSGMEEYGLYTPFRDGTRVTVTLPDGQRQGFTFAPTVHGIFDLVYFKPRFIPDPGVTSTLRVSDSTLNNLAGEYFAFGFGGGQPYNPAAMEFGGGYTLTLQDGTVLKLDGDTGRIQTIRDTNQNTLTFSETGIFSSEGADMLFERDAQGRITKLTDPNGNDVIYTYDAAGDLVAVKDLDGRTTSFKYHDTIPHYLDEVVDPLGRVGQRNEYDEHGRLLRVVIEEALPLSSHMTSTHRFLCRRTSWDSRRLMSTMNEET